MRIRPKFASDPQYRGTLFDRIEVSVADPSVPDALASASEYLATSLRGREIDGLVTRTHWPDRRRRIIVESWNLGVLLEKIDRVLSYGDLRPATEEHTSFTIERAPPENEIVTVASHGVYLREWRYEPLYRIGAFSILRPAREALVEVHTYVRKRGSE